MKLSKKFKLIIVFKDKEEKFKQQFDSLSELVEYLIICLNLKPYTRKENESYLDYVKNLILSNWSSLNFKKIVIKKYSYEKIYIINDENNNPKSIDFIVEQKDVKQ